MFPIRSLFTAALLTTAVTGCHFDMEGKYQAEKAVSEEFALDGASTIDIEFPIGEVRLSNGPDNTVTVAGRVIAKGDDQEQLDEVIAEFAFRTATSERLELTTPKAERGVHYTVDLDIAVPKGKDLDVSLNVGALMADVELPANAEFALNVGDLDIRLPAGAAATVSAEVNVGDVSVRGFDLQTGAVERRSFVGAVFDGRIGPEDAVSPKDLRARVNVGDIDIRAR
jgi:hypothetical protein